VLDIKFENETENEYWYETGIKEAISDLEENNLYVSLGGTLDLDVPLDIDPVFYDAYLEGYWFIVHSVTY